MRTRSYLVVFIPTLLLALSVIYTPLLRTGSAQTATEKNFRPDRRHALAARPSLPGTPTRPGAYISQRKRTDSSTLSRPRTSPSTSDVQLRSSKQSGAERRAPAHAASLKPTGDKAAQAHSTARTYSQRSGETTPAAVIPGTPLSRVLHVSQLSLVNSDGTHEEFVDRDGDLVADDRTTFDARGGSYDVAVGRTGSRYEVFTAIDDRGTATTSDDVSTGVLVVALDTNGDYVRDASSTFDLGRDYALPSAVSVVSGTSRAGREFVVVSSSGYFNSQDPHDPANEPSPGVVLLVRDASTGGFDATRSRSLVSVGDNRLFNANALALLPNGNLVVADFQSNELRIIRDTNDDGMPDTLDAKPFYTFAFNTDAPLDMATNSRGVVFTHSTGNDTYMLAVYDTNGDGYADTDEVCVEGLSIDNNLVLHGLTVARDGTVYVIEDATGESDRPADGGNGGIPRVDAFPDSALNGVLRDGVIFVLADDEFTQAYSGLSFGVETVLPPVARLTLTNSASLEGDAPSGGLATIKGTGLTRGRSGATQTDAAARGLRVTVEGLAVPVLSFDDSNVHIQVPQSLGTGLASVVVSVGGSATAADDARIVTANPGLFTVTQTGTGEAVALLVSGSLYTRAPFAARFNNNASEVALFGTGWRNSPPVTVQIGGKAAKVNYAGPSGGFPGLDQLNVVIPDGVNGPASVLVTTSGGATSRSGVFITVQ
ncbi:MAG: hypothetical protein QOE46_1381 [Acidobacteriota bacterium]|jgi:uncharacterized protein (TIGR03437 family)|nr:hypothetical protein [Acidobacteriota bacterium]